MSTSPEDRIVTVLSRWLARHVSDDELRATLADVRTDALSPDQAEAIDELRAELSDPAGHAGEREMVVRETLEALSLDQVEAVEDLREELRSRNGRGELEMVVRETLEALALGG